MPIYMKIPGVEGSGKDQHKGWIELESCQLGTNRHVTNATGRGTNREASVPSVSEIVVTKLTDVASSGLFALSIHGEGKKVQIDFVKDDSPSQVPYLSLELENTLISSYSVSGHGGDAHGRPMESLSLNFAKVTYSTTPVEPSHEPKHAQDRASWGMAVGRP